MKELIPQLRQAAKAYYQESREIMSNFEYDKLYDELSALEAKTGIILSGSPTQQVGYQVLSELPKETHEEPMLSLDKTKSVEDLQQWLGSQKGLLSWKMDGLTVVLTYENGTLAKAVTRGNGEIGEVITPNARAFSNIPLTIAYKGQLIIRGEADKATSPPDAPLYMWASSMTKSRRFLGEASSHLRVSSQIFLSRGRNRRYSSME